MSDLSELSEYFKEKYSKKRLKTEDLKRKTQVKNQIVALVKKYLKPGDTLIIEALPKDLDYAMVVFNEEPLRTEVRMEQTAENLFAVKMIELEL